MTYLFLVWIPLTSVLALAKYFPELKWADWNRIRLVITLGHNEDLIFCNIGHCERNVKLAQMS